MRKPNTITSTLLVSLLCLSAHAATKQAATRQPKAADLLNKATAAMGGAATVDAIKTMELHGSSKRVLPNGESWSLSTVSYYQFPNLYRQEATLPIGGTLITIVNPQGAFLQTGQSGGVQLPDEQKVEISRSILRSPIAILQRRASLNATVEGKQKVDKKDAFVIQLNEDIGPTKVAVDAKSGEIIQISYPTAGGMDPKPTEMAVTYADYRSVGKLRYPHSSIGTIAGKPVFEFKADKVVANGTIKDTLFAAAPVAPEPPATNTAGNPPAPAPMNMPGMPEHTMTTTTAPPAPTTTQPPAKPPKG